MKGKAIVAIVKIVPYLASALSLCWGFVNDLLLDAVSIMSIESIEVGLKVGEGCTAAPESGSRPCSRSRLGVSGGVVSCALPLASSEVSCTSEAPVDPRRDEQSILSESPCCKGSHIHVPNSHTHHGTDRSTVHSISILRLAWDFA